ncbi:hypothetical protein [uncultured Microbacterium sp.]|uniref:hypothetical protein n=1 Tax=uncultured Microbacterium sp. TaxID=191216 RepID=UPI0025DC7CA0|nr:hypothetical protein [uncultured Microbacterium sp.]
MSTTPPPPGPYEEPAARSQAYGESAPAVGYGAPAAPAHVEPPRRRVAQSKRLGVVAFVVSLIAVVGGSIIAFIGGLQSGAIAPYAESTGQIDPSTVPAEAQQAAVAVAVLSVVAFLLYGVLGLWGFVQGIIAAVKNRGRGWAIGAIALAVLGGVAVVVALGVGAAVGVGSAM